MTTIADVLAIATAVFAIATWIVPPVRYALSFRKKPRDSLTVVGRVIGMIVLAAVLSAAGSVLALLTLAFTAQSFWGWVGLGTIAGFWLALAVYIGVGSYFSQRRRERERRS